MGNKETLEDCIKEMEETEWVEINKEKDIKDIRDALNTLNPHSINIGCIEVQLCGNLAQRSKQIEELRGMENELLQNWSEKMENKLPTADINMIKPSTEEYNQDTLAMLSQDLIQHERISLDTLIKMQGEEEYIKTIRENLVGNRDAYNTFMLKSGLVCKKLNIHHSGLSYVGIYIPTIILRAVIQYVHRKNLHTSATQTLKDFQANYYHPKAAKITKEICRECIICTQS
jgi:hypothetical protein